MTWTTLPNDISGALLAFGASGHYRLGSTRSWTNSVTVIQDVTTQHYIVGDIIVKLVRVPDRFLIIWSLDFATMPEPFRGLKNL